MEYTKDQLNYFRICYITFNLIVGALRKVFKGEWDSRYKARLGEWEDTAKNGLDFFNKESKKPSHGRKAAYLVTIKNGKTDEWDCSCLFFALLFSSSIGLLLSATTRSAIDDLRQVRNKIAHISGATLTDTQFQNHVGIVLNAFKSLSLPISDIETVKNQKSFPTAEVNGLKAQAANLQAELQTAKSDVQDVKDAIKAKEEENLTLTSELKEAKEEMKCLTEEINRKVESFCLFTSSPPHPIILRRKDVTKIMGKLKVLEERSNRAVSTVYLSGIPGCGKSQVARQIGEQFFTTKSGESKGLTFVATLNAESLKTLTDSYLSLAKKLGITEYTVSKLAITVQLGSAGKTIRHLQRLIRPITNLFSNWLMIADNVEDLPLVRSFLPQTGCKDWGLGQVLITTQDASAIPTSAPHTYHESLSAGMMLDDAVQLLKVVSQIVFSHEQAEEVVEVLEFQPLALAAAAFYVNTVVNHGSPNYTWKNYLEVCSRGERESTEKLLATESEAYPKTMTTSIKMALKTFSDREDVLRQTFLLFSLIASDPLPIEVAVDFVRAQTSGNTDELIRAKILKSSLITCLYNENGTPEYLKIHNTVFQILKETSTSSFSERERVPSICHAISGLHSLTESERGNSFQSPEVCVKLRKVTAHSKSLHNILNPPISFKSTLMKRITSFITLNTIVLWLSGTAAVCCDLSNPSDANLFSTSARELAVYSDSLVRANALTVHGRVLMMLCHHNISIRVFERAIEIYKKSDGAENPKLIKAYNDLGNIYRITGNYHAAKECFEKAIEIIEKSHFEVTAEVADVYQKMGNLLHDLGKNTIAKDYFENALNISKSIYGETDAHVAKCYNSLAVVYVELGKYIESKECLEKALAIQKEIYGEEHGDVATSYSHLGIFHRKLENFIEAKDYFEKALMIIKKIYYPEHADLAVIFDNFGTLYSDLGNYNEAKESHKKALVIRRKIYHDEHADVATSYNNLGTVYSKLKKNNKAKECYEKALIIRKKIYDEEHSHIASSYNNLGIVYSNLGKFNEAKKYYQKALVIMKKVYDEEHADVASNYSNLGTVYAEVGSYKEAKEYHEKALTIRKKIQNEEHSHVAASYNNLGIVNSHCGKHIEALEYFEKALAIRKKIFGEEHTDVAESYHNLGVVYSHLAKYNEAKEHYEKALFIWRKIYGEEHGDVAASYNSLGVVYGNLGKYSEAKEYLKKALIIREKIYREEHADVAASYNNLGVVYGNLGEDSKAKKLYEKALFILKKIYYVGHELVAAIYRNLVIVCSQRGEHSEAKNYFKKVLVIVNSSDEVHAAEATSSINPGNIDNRLRRVMNAKNSKRKH